MFCALFPKVFTPQVFPFAALVLVLRLVTVQ